MSWQKRVHAQGENGMLRIRGELRKKRRGVFFHSNLSIVISNQVTSELLAIVQACYSEGLGSFSLR